MKVDKLIKLITVLAMISITYQGFPVSISKFYNLGGSFKDILDRIRNTNSVTKTNDALNTLNCNDNNEVKFEFNNVRVKVNNIRLDQERTLDIELQEFPQAYVNLKLFWDEKTKTLKIPYLYIDRPREYSKYIKLNFDFKNENIKKLIKRNDYIFIHFNRLCYEWKFSDTVRENTKYYKKLLDSIAEDVKKLTCKLKSKDKKLNKIDEYENVKLTNEKIKNINKDVNTKKITISNIQLESERLTNELNLIKDRNNKIKSDISSQLGKSADIKKMITTYKKNADRFVDNDAAVNYLNDGQLNLCRFHIAAEDITLIAPEEKLNINEIRVKLTKDKEYKFNQGDLKKKVFQTK